MNFRTPNVTLLMAMALCIGSSPALARRDAAGPTPPRVALVDGVVSFWRPGAEDWTTVKVNTALAEGDELYVADNGNVELQIGSRAFVRGGADTRLGLEALSVDTQQYKVTGGHAAFDLQRLPDRQVVEIDTPRAAFTVDRPGYYRVDVEDQRTTFSARRGGRARVVAENGQEREVGVDQQLVLSDDNPGFGVTPVAAVDDWDRWNEQRTASFAETPRSAAYVSEVAGIDELDRYGDWREEPRYGRVWVPRNVGADWSPYSAGRWVYDPYYEWTWVDDAPWGWAPYHYGRWVHTSSYWGWAPGPVVVQPAYAPALVAFFGAPGVSVSVGIGAPFVSWVPLGYGEPVIPWWGGASFVGRPYWGGWGGPRVVNNVVLGNSRYVNVGHIDRYQNAMVHNAVVGLDRDRFRRGDRPGRLREAGDLRLRPVHGALGVRPAAHSFVPSEGRGRRPPERLRDRSVVATRAAGDPIHRLRARGVDVASAPTPSAKPRIVHPRGGGASRLADRRQQPDAGTGAFGTNERQHRFDRGFDRAGVDRRARERMAPERQARRVETREQLSHQLPKQLPTTRGERARAERPRSAPQEHAMRRMPAPERNVRRAPAPSSGRERAMRNRPRDTGRAMQRQAPRMDRQVERGAPRPQNGRGHGHQREG